jgi:hypothetical protein
MDESDRQTGCQIVTHSFQTAASLLGNVRFWIKVRMVGFNIQNQYYVEPLVKSKK